MSGIAFDTGGEVEQIEKVYLTSSIVLSSWRTRAVNLPSSPTWRSPGTGLC